MIADHRFVRAAAARITEAADSTCAALAEGLIRNPRIFTDRLLRRTAKEVDRFRSHDLRWRAQAFVDKHADGAFVADIVGSLEVDLPDYTVRKGFLARPLFLPNGRPPTHDDLDDLRLACSVMLAVSPASYVFVYKPTGVIVVPATAVIGSVARPDRLHRRSIGRFYEEHFSCFIGDPRITGAKAVPLEELARHSQARTGLALHVEPASTPRQESLFRR